MSRFTGGWVKLYRELLDKDIHQNLILWGLWNHLLIIAVYKDTQLLWMGKQRILKPGQCVFGIKELAEKWEISRSVIQKWLHYLHDTQRIVFESCSRGSLVTICNWELYQVSEDEPCSPRVNDVLTACSPRVNGEALNEEVQEGKKKRSKNAGIRLDYPPEFETLWVLYERKGDKKASYLEFKKLNLLPPEIILLETAIRNYLRKKEDPQFRKDFERFLQMDWRELATAYTNGHAKKAFDTSKMSKEELIAKGFICETGEEIQQ